MTNEQTTLSHLAAQHPVRGLLRFGVRLPLWLYRLHLGWLLGERLLRLTSAHCAGHVRVPSRSFSSRNVLSTTNFSRLSAAIS